MVVNSDDEFARYIKTADAAGLSLSEWARQALRAAEREFSSGDVEAKLAAIGRAASYSVPVPDVETLRAEMEAERLAEIEAGFPGLESRLIFVDSNVPMYLIGNEPRRKAEVRLTLERLAGERRRLVTSSEVFQELLYRYAAGGRRDAIEPAFDALRAIVDDVLAVEWADGSLRRTWCTPTGSCRRVTPSMLPSCAGGA